MRVNESDLSTDDDVYLDYEVAKNACQTLKRYFEAHVMLISDELKHSKPLSNEIPKYKVCLYCNSGILSVCHSVYTFYCNLPK